MNSQKSYQRDYYLKNRKRILAKRQLCKEDISIYNREYYTINKEKENQRARKWRKKNKKEIRNYNQTYKNDNKKKLAQQSRRYRANNKEKVLVWKKNYREKIKNDPILKLRYDLSRSIRQSLAKLGTPKNKKSVWDYLPYSKEDLRSRIESLFEPWMNWKNWGKYNPRTWDDNDPTTWTWNIDHIIPHSKFAYSSMKSKTFRECWALKNLRPYSSKLNVLEGDRRI